MGIVQVRGMEVVAVLLQRVMRGVWVALTQQYMKQTHCQ